MQNNLVISIFIIIFASWIGGSHEPPTRVIQQPFHFVNCWNYLNVGSMKGNPLTTEQFVEKAKRIHGDKYDYSQTKYYRSIIPVEIICPIHGVFLQKPNKHLSGHGCHRCSFRYKYSKEEFIKEATFVHKDKYDYSKVVFTQMTKPVTIICPIHGEFTQIAHVHLRGFGCAKCGHEIVGSNNRMPIKEWIERASKIHKCKYDYSLVNKIKNQNSVVRIICPTHGIFTQSVGNHICGHGCPYCKRSLGEDKVASILDKYGVKYTQQFNVYNENLFCKNVRFEIDFFISEKNIFIEYNGKQHYMPIEQFGGEEKFKEQQERDMALRQHCKEHKIKLVEIPYWDYNNIETILKKELKIK